MFDMTTYSNTYVLRALEMKRLVCLFTVKKVDTPRSPILQRVVKHQSPHVSINLSVNPFYNKSTDRLFRVWDV